MNVKNCRLCGRIYNYVAGPNICPACRDGMEAKFQEVKEYIRSHKGCGIQEVSEACDVEPGQIRQWLREDRLEVTEDSAIFLNCESCGAPIRSGRFCGKCTGSMMKGFNDALGSGQKAAPPKQPAHKDGDKAKMRFL